MFVGYAREIKNILFYAELKKMENISKKYRERQPPTLTTQFGERLSKTEAIKRQEERKSNVTSLFPTGNV